MQRLLRRVRGTGPRATGTEAFFFVGRSIDIKVLTDLFCLLRLCSIDIKVFQTFAAPSCAS